MGQPQKSFLSFCNILVCVKVDYMTSGWEIYIQVQQECLLLKGCPGHPAGSELELIAVGLCAHKNYSQ